MPSNYLTICFYIYLALIISQQAIADSSDGSNTSANQLMDSTPSYCADSLSDSAKTEQRDYTNCKDTIPGPTLPLPSVSSLGPDLPVTPNVTSSDVENACTARFDGRELSIPCLKISGHAPLYKANLAVVAYGPIMLFRVKDASALSPPEMGTIDKLAAVESIEILAMESFPVRINVVAKGYLRNSCEYLDVSSDRPVHLAEGNIFKIELNVRVPASQDISCLDVVSPFEHTVQLDVRDLSAGIYTVDINGIRGTFELSMKNSIDQLP